MMTADPADARTKPAPASTRVLALGTSTFTLMFAAWLMFGILGVPIREEFGITDVQLSWISAVAILNGSLWRLPAGIIADRVGGRIVMTVMCLIAAVASFLVSRADSFTAIVLLAFFVGFAGNSFSVGVAWTSAWFSRDRQGAALGLFGAGNIGASVTKFIGPPVIAATTGTLIFGVVPGGWRLIPVIYAVLLVVAAAAVWFLAPTPDRHPAQGRSLVAELQPLKQLRVWRFGLYYVAAFGAYVALAAWLPKYYVDNFDVTLQVAALLTALFIFPASLLRPVGGWFSDKLGARRVMYWTFAAMLATTLLLSLPNGSLKVEVATSVDPSGYVEALPFTMNIWLFTALVFLLGCSMGIGKAAIYKHIPDYFPNNVGAVGGLVGMIGGLGGFFLPPLFAYATRYTGLPSMTFFVLFLLTAVCAVWMHLTVWSMMRGRTPELSEHFEHPPADDAAADHPTVEQNTREDVHA